MFAQSECNSMYLINDAWPIHDWDSNEESIYLSIELHCHMVIHLIFKQKFSYYSKESLSALSTISILIAVPLVCTDKKCIIHNMYSIIFCIFFPGYSVNFIPSINSINKTDICVAIMYRIMWRTYNIFREKPRKPHSALRYCN